MAYRQKEYNYNDKLTKDQNLLMDKLYKMRMSGMAEAFENQLMNPNSGLESFETRFSEIINHEWSGRENKKIITGHLVIDDFGLMDLNLDKCRDLFEIIEARDCRKSTVIISQMPVANWYQLFGDNTYADACLSRMTSKAYRLDFPGRDRRVESK